MTYKELLEERLYGKDPSFDLDTLILLAILEGIEELLNARN